MSKILLRDKIPVAVVPIVKFRKAQGLLSKYIDRKYRVAFSDLKAFFPISEHIPSHIMTKLQDIGVHFDHLPSHHLPLKTVPLSLKLLEKKYGLPLPKSINLIGDILTINELPGGCEGKEDTIGRILRSNFGVRAVFLKSQKFDGVSRVARWIKLCGWGDTFTLHRESGCMFALDISKVFFNPRLSQERIRIAGKVKDNETIIDMFAGVGSFGIIIGKKRLVHLYAIDINPHAVEFMRINTILNKVHLEVLLGDARERILDIKENADRIIMNYPEASLSFLDLALQKIKKPGTIHVYLFVTNGNIQSARDNIESIIRTKLGEEINITVDYRIVSEVAPYKFLVCYDALIA